MPGAVNVTAQINATGQIIYTNVTRTYVNTTQVLLQNCSGTMPSGLPGANQLSTNGKNCNGGLYTNAGITQAFAFIVNGLPVLITDIIQLPILDWEVLQLMVYGMSGVLPSQIIALLDIGVNCLYLYMASCMLIMGASSIQKYNMRQG